MPASEEKVIEESPKSSESLVPAAEAAAEAEAEAAVLEAEPQTEGGLSEGRGSSSGGVGGGNGGDDPVGGTPDTVGGSSAETEGESKATQPVSGDRAVIEGEEKVSAGSVAGDADSKMGGATESPGVGVESAEPDPHAELAPAESGAAESGAAEPGAAEPGAAEPTADRKEEESAAESKDDGEPSPELESDTTVPPKSTMAEASGEPQQGDEVGAEAGAKPDAETSDKEDKAETPRVEATPESKADTSAEVMATPESKTAPEAKAEATPETETAPEAKAEATPEAKAEAAPEAKAEATPEAKAEATPEAKAEATADGKHEEEEGKKPPRISATGALARRSSAALSVPSVASGGSSGSGASRRRSLAWGDPRRASGGGAPPPGVRPPSGRRRLGGGIRLKQNTDAGVEVMNTDPRAGDAAKTIGRVARGRMGRKRAAEAKRKAEAAALDHAAKAAAAKAAKEEAERRAGAATKVQSIARGRRGRAKAKQLREEAEAYARAAEQAERERAAAEAAAAERIKVAVQEALAEQAEIHKQQLEEKDELVAGKSNELEELRARVNVLERQVTSLKEREAQLQKEAEDYYEEAERLEAAEEESEAAIRDAEEKASQYKSEIDKFEQRMDEIREELAEKDNQVSVLSAEASRLTGVLDDSLKKQKVLESENQRLADEVEELTRPETKDVMLSARSYKEETNLLIEERDGAIQAAESRIKTLSDAHSKLMTNVDEVESEVERMQGDIVVRDEAFTKKKLECERLKREVDRLQGELEVARGKEFAMDVATKQNEALLQLLEAAEAAAEKSSKERDEALARAKESEAKRLAAVKDGAKHEAEAYTLRHKTETTSKMLSELSAITDAKLDKVTSELKSTRQSASVQTETMAEELRIRREKQYELLDRLRILEDNATVDTDRADAAEAQVTVLQGRVMELDSQLMQANKWRETENMESAEKVAAANSEIKRLMEQLELTEDEVRALRKQAHEMGGNVIRMVDKEHAAEEAVATAKEKTKARDGEIAVLRERVATLADEAQRASVRFQNAEAALRTVKHAHEQLVSKHAELEARYKGMRPRGTAVNPDGSMAATSLTRTGEAAGAIPMSTAGAPQVDPRGPGGPSTDERPESSGGSSAGGPGDRQLRASVREYKDRLDRSFDCRRAILERALRIHCGTAPEHSAPEPPSHLLHPDSKETTTTMDTSAATGSMSIAALLFGADTSGVPFPAGPSAGPMYSSAPMPGSAGGFLDLSGTALNDEDVAILADVLGSTPAYPRPAGRATKGGIHARSTSAIPASPHSRATSLQPMPRPLLALDLRSNRITDAGAVMLAELIAAKSIVPPSDPKAKRTEPRPGAAHIACRLALIDLRGNGLSAVGVRALAEALRASPSLEVQHVHVGGDGLIRALGKKTHDAHSVGFDVRDVSNEGIGVVAVIDCRANAGQCAGDPMVEARQIRTHLSARASVKPDYGRSMPPPGVPMTLHEHREASMTELRPVGGLTPHGGGMGSKINTGRASTSRSSFDGGLGRSARRGLSPVTIPSPTVGPAPPPSIGALEAGLSAAIGAARAGALAPIPISRSAPDLVTSTHGISPQSQLYTPTRGPSSVRTDGSYGASPAGGMPSPSGAGRYQSERARLGSRGSVRSSTGLPPSRPSSRPTSRGGEFVRPGSRPASRGGEQVPAPLFDVSERGSALRAIAAADDFLRNDAGPSSATKKGRKKRGSAPGSKARSKTRSSSGPGRAAAVSR